MINDWLRTTPCTVDFEKPLSITQLSKRTCKFPASFYFVYLAYFAVKNLRATSTLQLFHWRPNPTHLPLELPHPRIQDRKPVLNQGQFAPIREIRVKNF